LTAARQNVRSPSQVNPCNAQRFLRGAPDLESATLSACGREMERRANFAFQLEDGRKKVYYKLVIFYLFCPRV
jgi:hypothetical protein